MKTVEINLYSFNELSEGAKEVAINKVRGDCADVSYLYDEAHESVKVFHDIFGTKEGNRSWLDCNTDSIEDNVLELKGMRLRTYIINNFGNRLFKGKYFSLWSKTEVSYKHHKEGYPVLKSRYSRVMLENSCVMTGVCYDESLLQPVYEFLQWNERANYNSYMTFEALMNDCFENLTKDIESEEEYQNSDEAIIETIESNGYTFEGDGTMNNG